MCWLMEECRNESTTHCVLCSKGSLRPSHGHSGLRVGTALPAPPTQHLAFLLRSLCLQGRQAYMDKRPPDFSRFKRLP